MGTIFIMGLDSFHFFQWGIFVIFKLHSGLFLQTRYYTGTNYVISLLHEIILDNCFLQIPFL